MIGYSAKIDVFSASDGEVDYAQINGVNETVANGNINYVGDVLSDENGEFWHNPGAVVTYPTPYVVILHGSNMRGVTMEFNTQSEEYPKTIYSNAYKTETFTTTVTTLWDTFSGKYMASASISVGTHALEIVSVERSYTTTTTLKPTPTSGDVTIASSGTISIREFYSGSATIVYTIVAKILDTDAEPIKPKSPKQVVSGATPLSELILYIPDWSEPNKPLVISRIYCGDLSINIDRYNILSFNSETIDRKTMGKPSYGVISNSGTITVADTTREILDYHKNGLLKTGLPCKIFLNNTLTEKSEQIDEKHTKAWAYNELSAMVKISVGDDLMEWQDIQVASTVLQPEQNMLWVYNYLKEITPSRWQFEELDSNTTDYLSKIKLPYPYFDGGSLWSAWDKLAQACGLHIFKHNNKVIVKHDI